MASEPVNQVKERKSKIFDEGVHGREGTILKQRGRDIPQLASARRKVLGLLFIAAFALAACIASPQPGLAVDQIPQGPGENIPVPDEEREEEKNPTSTATQKSTAKPPPTSTPMETATPTPTPETLSPEEVAEINEFGARLEEVIQRSVPINEGGNYYVTGANPELFEWFQKYIKYTSKGYSPKMDGWKTTFQLVDLEGDQATQLFYASDLDIPPATFNKDTVKSIEESGATLIWGRSMEYEGPTDIYRLIPGAIPQMAKSFVINEGDSEGQGKVIEHYANLNAVALGRQVPSQLQNDLDEIYDRMIVRNGDREARIFQMVPLKFRGSGAESVTLLSPETVIMIPEGASIADHFDKTLVPITGVEVTAAYGPLRRMYYLESSVLNAIENPVQ